MEKTDLLIKNVLNEHIGSEIHDLDEYGLIVPLKAWFNLREACELKGISYKTACNKTYLQPNRGISEGSVGGRKVFTRKTIINWLPKTDSDIRSDIDYEESHS